MPDGRVIYGEQPVAGAKKVEEIIPQTGRPASAARQPRPSAAAEARARISARRDDERKQKIKQASSSSRTPRLRRQPARNFAGERQGTAGGASRLNEAYDERQKALEDAVINARKAGRRAQGRSRLKSSARLRQLRRIRRFQSPAALHRARARRLMAC